MQIPRMRIPVFVSCPSELNPDQEKSAQIIFEMIEKNKLEWRALGRSDYPNKLPLREVLRMIRHCSGGIILGFEQYHVSSAIYRRGCGPDIEKQVNEPMRFPTPWNNLEAGILFNQKLPILIFKEDGINGGIFDVGTSEVFIHKMPSADMPAETLDDLDSVFQNWAAEVRNHYYED